MIIWKHKPRCTYRQEELKTVPCHRCPGGGVYIKVFRCEKYGACTILKRYPRIQCCETCPTHTVDQPSTSVDMQQH